MSDVEMLEVYSATAERSGNLAERWGKKECGGTSDVVRGVVIWMKH